MAKDRPILFSSTMVRALLEGDKTQTRRVMKPQPSVHENGSYSWNGKLGGFVGFAGTHIEGFPKHAASYCPYGKVGDLLWVRETFAASGFGSFERFYYRADGESQFMGTMKESNGNITDYYTDYWVRNGEKRKGSEWKPSLHMPRRANRITLEIVNVRVERLHAISDQDCFSEGVGGEDDEYYNRAEHYSLGGSSVEGGSVEKCAFIGLWCSINGRDSWEANPWVWVVEFKVHQCNVNALLKQREAA